MKTAALLPSWMSAIGIARGRGHIGAGEPHRVVRADVIEANNKRIEEMTARLDRQRERLLLQFYNIETTVARLQDNLTALSSLQIIPPLSSTRNS